MFVIASGARQSFGAAAVIGTMDWRVASLFAKTFEI